MNRYTLLGKLLLASAVLAFLLNHHGRSTGQLPVRAPEPAVINHPDLHGDEGLAQSFGSVNLTLRDQYRELAGSQAHGVNVAVVAGAVFTQLDKLIKNDAALRKLGRDGIDGIIRESAERDRVQAFIHAWACFTLLAVEADRTRADLSSLIALEGPAAKLSLLSNLLQLAEEIRASGDSDEAYKNAERESRRPMDLLQYRLADGTLFPVEFAYHQEWGQVQKPSFLKHDRYIPSFDDLVGKPSDSPGPIPRDIVSLWALVNQLLDRNCDLFAHCEKESDRSVDPKAFATQAAWLAAFRARLGSFDMAFGREKINDRLIIPLGRIEAFLRFRVRATEPGALAGMAQAFAQFRRESPNNESPDAKKSRLLRFTATNNLPLKNLIDAATPIDTMSPPFYHAASWLRYVLLLSYQGQRNVVANSQSPSGMEQIWTTFGTKLPLDWVEKFPTWKGDRVAPAIRWNNPPYAGQSSAVVSDLSQTCFELFRFDAFIAGRQKDRFNAVNSSLIASTYISSDFRKNLDNLTNAYLARVAPYFLQAPDETTSTRNPPFGEPKRLAELDVWRTVAASAPDGLKWQAAFATSTTATEQQRLRDDLRVLAIELQRSIQLQTSIRDTVDNGNPMGSLRLASTGPQGIGDLEALPRKTFEQYKKDLDDRINNLKTSVTAIEVSRALVQAYTQSRGQLDQARAELDAAMVGQRIAGKASQLSECFQEIAVLDTKIEDLGQQMAVMEKQAQEKLAAAVELRLVVATRFRDLAARKVEALIFANKQAEEIARQAIEDIDSLAGQFLQAAAQIRDQRAKERAFGILKAVVSVVGAVLAPFTGGASMVVASMLNMAIDIYKRIDETNWKNFGDSVAAVGDISQDAVGIVDTGINNFGGPKAKAALKDVKTYIKKGTMQLENLTGDAKKLFEQLKAAGQDRIGVVVALANGLPVSFGDTGGLRIELGKHRIKFSDPQLQKMLNDLYANGWYILNDLEKRGGEGFAKLTDLPSSELKTKLSEALNGVARELPPEIAGSLNLPGDATQKAQAALMQLRTYVEGGMSDETRLLLAQTLASGMLFVKEGGVVVSIERPFDREAEKFQSRLEAYGRRVAEGAIGDLVTKIGKIRDDLDRKGQDLMKASDDEGLVALANSSKSSIDDVKTETKKLADEINKARDELADKEDERTIVDYEAQAARLLVDKAGTLVKQSELHQQRARLVVKQSNIAADLELLRGEQADDLIRAAKLKVARFEDSVRNTYGRCLTNGIDPQSPDVANPSGVPLAVASLRGVISGDPELCDIANRSGLEAAAANVLGMIQWCQMLGITDGNGKTPADYYASLVATLASSDPLWPTAEGERNNSIGGRIASMGQELNRLFEQRAGVHAEVPPPAGGTILPKNILWRSDPQFGSKVDECIQDLSDEDQKMVLGVTRYRITIAGADRDRAGLSATTRDIYPVPKVLPGRNASYFVDLDKISLITERQNIYFVLIPPAMPRAQSGRSMIYGTLMKKNDPASNLLKLRDADPSEVAGLRREQLEKDLRLLKGVNFTGALGEWTIVILDSTANDAATRTAAIEAIKRNGSFTLQIFYVKVESPLLTTGR